jgi:hypothetical protein
MQLDQESESGDVLHVIKGLLDTGEGDAVAQESFRRHYEHLEELAANLRRLGMDEHQIDENIMEIFKEYERELVSYITRK